MFEPGKFDDLIQKMSQALENSPAKDIEKNLRALLSSALTRIDVVPRSDFDTQVQVALRLNERVEALEARVAQLEKQIRDIPTEQR